MIFSTSARGIFLRAPTCSAAIFPSRINLRIFATGSYQGTFRGELNAFARLAERETAE